MANDNALRWGILGTARINRRIIGPLRDLGHELVAVASRDAARGAAYARDWAIAQAYDSYERLLADPRVEAVYLPLPNALHAEWTIKCAAAGKHVLCEKPLALTVADVDAIRDAATRHGVVVAEAFMYRHHPVTAAAKRLVREGAVGQVRHVRGAFTFPLTRDGDVRLDPALGGGSLWDVGCYPVSWMRHLLDAEPIEVSGLGAAGSTGVDLSFAGTLRFPGDILGIIESSFRAPYRTEIEVVGSEGVLVVPEPFKPGIETAIVLRRGDAVERVPVEGEALFQGELRDMAEAVRTGRPPRVTLEDSRGTVATIVALYESARAGPVTL